MEKFIVIHFFAPTLIIPHNYSSLFYEAYSYGDKSCDLLSNREIEILGLSEGHYAIGKIRYEGEDKPSGTLLYIKSSLTEGVPVDVGEYALKHPTFPHQTTGDQFFDEGQFESYRKLGLHIAGKAMEDRKVLRALNLKVSAESTVEIFKGSLHTGVSYLINGFKEIGKLFTKS